MQEPDSVRRFFRGLPANPLYRQLATADRSPGRKIGIGWAAAGGLWALMLTLRLAFPLAFHVIMGRGPAPLSLLMLILTPALTAWIAYRAATDHRHSDSFTLLRLTNIQPSTLHHALIGAVLWRFGWPLAAGLLIVTLGAPALFTGLTIDNRWAAFAVGLYGIGLPITYSILTWIGLRVGAAAGAQGKSTRYAISNALINGLFASLIGWLTASFITATAASFSIGLLLFSPWMLERVAVVAPVGAALFSPLWLYLLTRLMLASISSPTP